MRPPQRTLLVPVIQIPADRRGRNLNRLGKVGQRYEPALTDEIEHALPTLLDQHGSLCKNLAEIYRFLSDFDSLLAVDAACQAHY
jgi:hypothetical protein